MARVKDLWKDPARKGKGKRWLAVWQLGDGRESSRAFVNKNTAATYGAKQELDIAEGTYISKAAGNGLFGPLAEKWLGLREVGASSATRYRQCYRIHVAPVFAERRAGDIKASDVAEWSRGLAKHPVTRHMALTIVTGTLDLAVADKMRRDNPARDKVVGRPPQPKGLVRTDPWNAERILAVSAACGDWCDVPVYAAATGTRQGECFALGAGDLDQAQQVVNIRRQLARHDSGQWVFKLPKGGKERTVPMPRVVATMAARAEILEVTLPWLDEDGVIGDPVTVPLLMSMDGTHLRFLPFGRRVWKPALEAVGLIPAYKRAGYPAARQHGMHAERHWYSTHLLDNGVSLAAVMSFMGHSADSAPLAIGVYGHVTPEAFETARQVLDKALARLRILSSDGTQTERGRAV